MVNMLSQKFRHDQPFPIVSWYLNDQELLTNNLVNGKVLHVFKFHLEMTFAASREPVSFHSD